MLQDLFYLFYPANCVACNEELTRSERIFCVSCRHHLPLYKFHYHNVEILKKVFSGRIPVENATALFVFEKEGLVQNVIHNLKYRGQQKIGTELGQWLGGEIIKSQSFKDVQIVIPVPLHSRRYRERGYNQVERFGKEIANILNVPYVDQVLKRTRHMKKQAKNQKHKRWDLKADAFTINNVENIQNKHVLLVDDLITTGATIEACANALLEIKGIRISIAAMAMTI